MITLVFFLFVTIIATLGYGLLYSYIFKKDFLELDIGYIGIFGCLFLITISYLTNIFFSHGIFHNLIIYFIGLSVSLTFFFKKKGYKNFFKKNYIIIFIFFFLLTGIFFYKTHDDFPYYHLPYTVNLIESKLIYGAGNFNHGYRTPSSIFYLNSLFYLPVIKYYSLHYGAFLILFFSNIILTNNCFKKNKNNFEKILSLFFLIFINVVFYRLAEHGTDRSGQIIAVILIINVFSIFKNKKINLVELNVLLSLIVLLVTLKTYFLVYLIFIPLLFFIFKIKNLLLNILINKNSYILVLILALYFHVNFANTGCIIYPIKNLCFVDFSWAMENKELERMGKHYEVWAKAGHTPNYRVKNPDEYIKNFNWISGWTKNYFFNKVSDLILGITTISLFVFLLFYKNKLKNNDIKVPYISIIYFLIFILFFLWFYKHPALRYGGYTLVASIIFIPLSYLIATKSNFEKSKNKFIFLILFSLIIFNGRNINRIIKENRIYNYNIIQNAYFYISQVSYKEILIENNLTIHRPVNNMCWSVPFPCTHRTNVGGKIIKGYKVFLFNLKND